MRRRNFIATSGTAVMVSAFTSLNATSSIYTSLSKSATLAEFPNEGINAIKKLTSELNRNLSNRQDIIENLVTPIRIIKNQQKRDKLNMVYKNKAGDYVVLSVKKGKETFGFYKDHTALPKMS